jgi:hypothetical protein
LNFEAPQKHKTVKETRTISLIQTSLFLNIFPPVIGLKTYIKPKKMIEVKGKVIPRLINFSLAIIFEEFIDYKYLMY